jgi:hypothetical protein
MIAMVHETLVSFKLNFFKTPASDAQMAVELLKEHQEER